MISADHDGYGHGLQPPASVAVTSQDRREGVGKHIDEDHRDANHRMRCKPQRIKVKKYGE